MIIFLVFSTLSKHIFPALLSRWQVVPEEPGEGLEGRGLLQVRTHQVAHHGTRVGGSQGNGTVTGLAGLLGE